MVAPVNADAAMPTPAAVDKVIIANRSAMIAKYASGGIAGINAALAQLVTSDVARGLTTVVVHIDDAAEMGAFGGAPVIAPTHESGAKAAVDAIYARLKPDYIVLLDGPDVVPHIHLSAIPGLADTDVNIPSDLPYACSGAVGLDPGSYLAVDRVVGRIPAAEGETDPGVLTGLILAAAASQPQPPSAYSNYFGLSADVWRVSTQLSLAAVFSSHAALDVAPPAGHPAIDASLPRLAHFINCHGGPANPDFYGQHGSSFPVALESRHVTAHASGSGTVVAAECCYGAQLYDYRLNGIDQPIAMAYLRNSAIAFLGSTNIAYGPAASSGQADLLCQYFMTKVLAGASTGRALLQARQQFILSQVMAHPQNLKTLAQFLLLGDPSLTAIKGQEATASPQADLKAAPPGSADATSQRKTRRAALASSGRAVAETASRPGRILKVDASRAEVRFREIAAERGYPPPTLLAVTGGRQFRRAAKDLQQEHRLMISVDPQQRPAEDGQPPSPSFRVITAYILDDGIVSVNECVSR